MSPFPRQVLADEQVTSPGAAGSVVWPLVDDLGSVRDLAQYDAQTDTTTVANHRVYDAFGNQTSETNAAVDCVFGFTGRLFDEATGLQNNLNRWYDAKTGRWLCEDPIGFAAGDANLYRYVGNSSTNALDPQGTEVYSLGGDGTCEWFYDSDTDLTFASYSPVDTQEVIATGEIPPGAVTPDGLILYPLLYPVDSPVAAPVTAPRTPWESIKEQMANPNTPPPVYQDANAAAYSANAQTVLANASGGAGPASGGIPRRGWWDRVKDAGRVAGAAVGGFVGGYAKSALSGEQADSLAGFRDGFNHCFGNLNWADDTGAAYGYDAAYDNGYYVGQKTFFALDMALTFSGIDGLITGIVKSIQLVKIGGKTIQVASLLLPDGRIINVVMPIPGVVVPVAELSLADGATLGLGIDGLLALQQAGGPGGEVPAPDNPLEAAMRRGMKILRGPTGEKGTF